MRLAWIVLIVVAGGVAAFVLDMPVYRLIDGYSEPYGYEHSQIVQGLEDFAQTVPPLAIIWAIWRLDRRQGRGVVLRMFLAFVLAGGLTGLGKLAVGRWRPEYFPGESWSQTWIDVGFHHRSSKQQSFYSGHSAAAFTMATIMSAYYPPLRPVVYTLATGCAASRVVTEQHWASDAYLGSVAGMALGWLFLPVRLRRARRDKGPRQGKLSTQIAGASSN